MSPSESKSGTNLNRVRMFGPDKLVKATAERKWDRVKIICTQPYTKVCVEVQMIQDIRDAGQCQAWVPAFVSQFGKRLTRLAFISLILSSYLGLQHALISSSQHSHVDWSWQDIKYEMPGEYQVVEGCASQSWVSYHLSPLPICEMGFILAGITAVVWSWEKGKVLCILQ